MTIFCFNGNKPFCNLAGMGKIQENIYTQVQRVGLTNFNKQLLDEVEHDIMKYQSRSLCYLPQSSASADNTDTRVWKFMISCENRIQ